MVIHLQDYCENEKTDFFWVTEGREMFLDGNVCFFPGNMAYFFQSTWTVTDGR